MWFHNVLNALPSRFTSIHKLPLATQPKQSYLLSYKRKKKHKECDRWAVSSLGYIGEGDYK